MRRVLGAAALGRGPAAGTTELGIDIIKVDRIRATLARFGAALHARVLTAAEQRYVRDRPGDDGRPLGGQGGRVCKVLGLGVRGIGWRDIEIERLPTGQPGRPAPRPGRGARRAARDGPHRGLDHPRVGLRGRDRVRRPHGRRALPLPARHRGAARRPRAAILARIERLRVAAEAGAAALASTRRRRRTRTPDA